MPNELTENQDLVMRLIAEGRDPVNELTLKKAAPSLKVLIERGYIRAIDSLTGDTRYRFTPFGRNYITNVTRPEQNVGTTGIPTETTNPFRT